MEKILKKELEEVRIYIKDDVISEISKLEAKISDLRNVIVPILEELVTSRSTGNEDLKEKIEYMKEKKFHTEKNFFFDSCINKLKKHQLTLENVNNHDLYIPLEGYYNLLSDRFPLLNKIISFVNNPDKRILLILGQSGAGKSSFTLHLTQYLLKNPILSQNSRVIPLYIPLARATLIKPETPVIQNLLNYYSGLNQQEIEFLLINRQFRICLIFDDIDHVQDNFIIDFYKELPDCYYIFTASLSKFKSVQNYEGRFFPVGSYEKRTLIFLKEKTIKLAPFNKEAKKKYISKFLKKDYALKSNLEHPEAIYQRMKAVPYLNEIISRPFFLMMTMEVFSYIEKYCKKGIHQFDDIQENLFHIYTHVIYLRKASEVKEKKGITNVNGISIYNCILNYSIKLAQMMRQKNIFEITDNEPEFKKFFTRKYTADLYKDGNDFKEFKYGYQGCAFIYSWNSRQSEI